MFSFAGDSPSAAHASTTAVAAVPGLSASRHTLAAYAKQEYKPQLTANHAKIKCHRAQHRRSVPSLRFLKSHVVRLIYKATDAE